MLCNQRDESTREAERSIRRAIHGSPLEQVVRAILFCIIVGMCTIIVGLMSYL